MLDGPVGGLPSLDRFVDPVFILPGMGYAVRQGLLRMTIQAESGELQIRLGDGTGSEGVLINLV